MTFLTATAPGALTIHERPAHLTNYSRAPRRPGEPSLVVIHATHGAEGQGPIDLNVAAGIAKALPSGKRVSFHYAVDADSAVRCVPDLALAWHAGKTGNARGIGVEICGRADQTRAQWLDGVSLRTLSNTARLVASLCLAHTIPPVLLDVPELLAGHRGITTHHRVSLAWGESHHWDPGVGFPLVDFVVAVSSAVISAGRKL